MVATVSGFDCARTIEVFVFGFEESERKTSAEESVLVGGITNTRKLANVVNEMSESKLILLQK